MYFRIDCKSRAGNTYLKRNINITAATATAGLKLCCKFGAKVPKQKIECAVPQLT